MLLKLYKSKPSPGNKFSGRGLKSSKKALTIIRKSNVKPGDKHN